MSASPKSTQEILALLRRQKPIAPPPTLPICGTGSTADDWNVRDLGKGRTFYSKTETSSEPEAIRTALISFWTKIATEISAACKPHEWNLILLEATPDYGAISGIPAKWLTKEALQFRQVSRLNVTLNLPAWEHEWFGLPDPEVDAEEFDRQGSALQEREWLQIEDSARASEPFEALQKLSESAVFDIYVAAHDAIESGRLLNWRGD